MKQQRRLIGIGAANAASTGLEIAGWQLHLLVLFATGAVVLSVTMLGLAVMIAGTLAVATTAGTEAQKAQRDLQATAAEVAAGVGAVSEDLREVLGTVYQVSGTTGHAYAARHALAPRLRRQGVPHLSLVRPVGDEQR